MASLVTLTTDFGTSSGYVAQMKGAFYETLFQPALASRPPFADVHLMDLSHDLPQHDVRAAAWFAATSCFYFPSGTLHIFVIDPGVGTSRDIVFAKIGNQQFLAPDNGLLTLAVKKHSPQIFYPVRLTERTSNTFHGRDIFAPSAAHLILGNTTCLGPPLERIHSIPWPEPQEQAGCISGEVIHVDHFGNLITNLPETLISLLQNKAQLSCGTTQIRRIVSTYGEAETGTLVGLAGSQGFLEIAVVMGRADQQLGAQLGTKVQIKS